MGIFLEKEEELAVRDYRQRIVYKVDKGGCAASNRRRGAF